MFLLPSPHIQIHRGSVVLDVRVDPKADPSVTARVGSRVIWRAVPRDWRAWKLAAMDVEGDGKQELLIAFHKHTRHSRYRLHTLSVYGFDGEHVYPKWRGSSMGRDFVDFVVIGPKMGERVVTLDRLLDGRYAVACHEWMGFGFRKIWEHGHWKSARITRLPAGVEVFTPEGQKKYDAGGHLLGESR